MPQCIRISRRSSSLSAFVFLRRLKNSSRTLTTIAFTLTPSASAHSLSARRVSADVEELSVGKLYADLACPHDLRVFAVNVVQSKKDDSGKIALYTPLLADCLTQVDREA